MVEYLIHDNGGRPFKVRINDGTFIEIFKECGKDYEKDPILTFEPKKIFIGTSPLNATTEFSGGYGPEFDGNSILLQISENEYVFIGACIYSFEPLNRIIVYLSPVGNNDVPYPYAIDVDGNSYLLINDVVIRDFPDEPDPYRYYYDGSLMTEDIGFVPQELETKNFQGIEKFYIDDQQYTLRSIPNPESNYDRVIPELGEKMYIVKNGVKEELSKDKYIQLMKDFNEFCGFFKLKRIKTYQERLY